MQMGKKSTTGFVVSGSVRCTVRGFGVGEWWGGE